MMVKREERGMKRLMMKGEIEDGDEEKMTKED